MRLLFGAVVLMSAALAAPAAIPVATASSSEAFTLKGAATPATGVPSYPVMAGDEVQAGNATTVLTLKDGSKLVLAPHAKAKIESTGDKTAARLLAGSWEYTLKSLTSVMLYAGPKQVTLTATTGQFSISAPTPVAATQAPAGSGGNQHGSEAQRSQVSSV